MSLRFLSNTERVALMGCCAGRRSSSVAYVKSLGDFLLTRIVSSKAASHHQQRKNFAKEAARGSMASYQPCLSMETLNPNIIALEYAVRGPLVIRAGEIEKELEKGVKKPFTEVIKANIGDCHAMGQVPITFIRQVLTLVTSPSLLDDPRFPDDAKERARTILKGCRGGSVGSYTDSPGIEIIRRHVAQYIERRDGIPADWQNVVISAGASDGIKNILKLMICNVGGKPPGVLIPIPQYPLYSASLAEFGINQVGYYLNESKNWSLDISELQRAITEAKKNCEVRAIVVINPGNPTGQVLPRENIEEIIKFAYKERLFVLADEVYQDNIYAPGSKFYSFKKVLMEMGEPYSSMELASFMSCSKGYMGECGLRGGYTEVVNMCPKVKAMYLKAISAMLCPTALGQSCLDAIVNPPQKGEPSYESFIKEKTAVLDSLKLRAKMVADTFNSMEGFSCNTVQGAMYAFPQITLPQKAIEAAKSEGKQPDVFYAFELLESTGICIVPGSGFGQKPGTYHFRTTILPQPEKLKSMLEKFAEFHSQFIKKYS
ncbi:alanine aminotransferase 1 [Sitophilus oryzae]|uniref:alanine transaminase n=1 Tax=Sitophilus oryzae TaxID=7048 RepID=A0A6J2YPT4_SITOR|nr:alanine aminotransferase 1 [Sitophilus oryzae]